VAKRTNYDFEKRQKEEKRKKKKAAKLEKKRLSKEGAAPVDETAATDASEAPVA